MALAPRLRVDAVIPDCRYKATIGCRDHNCATNPSSDREPVSWTICGGLAAAGGIHSSGQRRKRRSWKRRAGAGRGVVCRRRWSGQDAGDDSDGGHDYDDRGKSPPPSPVGLTAPPRDGRRPAVLIPWGGQHRETAQRRPDPHLAPTRLRTASASRSRCSSKGGVIASANAVSSR